MPPRRPQHGLNGGAERAPGEGAVDLSAQQHRVRPHSVEVAPHRTAPAG